MVFVTMSEKFVGRAIHGRNPNDEKLEKTSAKQSHMANVKGPPSSQQKSSRVAITSIFNGANVKGPLSSQQKSSRVATTTISNRENVKGPLSSQQKSFRMATTTISNWKNVKGPLSGQQKSSRLATTIFLNKENVKGPLSGQQKSSRVATLTIFNGENIKQPLSSQQKSSRMATTTISKRNTHLHFFDVKRNARVVPKPFRFQTDQRSIVRALNAERSPKLLKVNAEKSPKLVKRTSIDPLNFLSFETSGGESLIEEGVGDYEFIMGSAICYIFDGSHISEAVDGATTQHNPIPTGIGEGEKWLVSEAQMSSMDGVKRTSIDPLNFISFETSGGESLIEEGVGDYDFIMGSAICYIFDGSHVSDGATTQHNPIPTCFGEGEKWLVSEAQMPSMDGVKRTSIDPLNFLSFETSGGVSLIEEGVGDYEFIMGSAICYIFDGSHVLEAVDGTTTQHNPIPTGIGEDEKWLVSEAQMLSMDGDLDACADSTQQMTLPNRIQFHQILGKMKNGWFMKFKCQAWMETLMHALPLPNIIQFQHALVKMKNRWFLKFKAWMETLMHALTLPNRIQFQQALSKMKKGWFLKLNLKCQSKDGDLDACTDTTPQNPISTGIGEGEKGLVSQAQSQISSMDVDLDASTLDSEKKEQVVELKKILQMLSSNAYYLQWKASLFPGIPAISATSSNNGVKNSIGKSFSDNRKSTIATKDDSVLKVGGTTPLEKDLDSTETRIDGSKMKKWLLSDCGDAKKRLITMPNDLAPIIESSLTSYEESQCDQHSSVKKKEYIPGLRNSNSVNDSEYVKPRMTGSLSRNGYSYSIERVPKSSKAAVGSLRKQSEKEYLLNGTKPVLSYKELSSMTIIAKTSTRKFMLPAILEDASVASFSRCTRNVPPRSTKSVATVGAKNPRATFTQKHDRNIAACTRKIAKGAGLTEKSMTLTLLTIQVGSLLKKKHVANSVSMDGRTTRIGANRKSDLRSKEIEKVAELEREFQTLRTESSMLSAQLTSLQRDSAKCNELKVRLQFMEQHVDLQHALNDNLRELVDQLELLTSLIMDPSMKGITQKSAVLSSEQCNVLSNGHRCRLATATANLLSAAAGK